jgi:hypothetical protein
MVPRPLVPNPTESEAEYSRFIGGDVAQLTEEQIRAELRLLLNDLARRIFERRPPRVIFVDDTGSVTIDAWLRRRVSVLRDELQRRSAAK